MEVIDSKYFNNKKLALVLSGGVAKASAWHVGVALGLQELGFRFINNRSPQKGLYSTEIGTYVGSSAGAMIGLFLASGYTPEEIIHAAYHRPNLWKLLGFNLNKEQPRLRLASYRDFFTFKPPLSPPPLGQTFRPFDHFPPGMRHLMRPLAKINGLFSSKGLANYLEKEVLPVIRFEDFIADLFIVATQLDHSRKVIFSKFHYPSPSPDHSANYYTGISVIEAAAASMSVPPIFSPYPIRNPYTQKIDYYLDGEIRDTLSTHVAVDHGCDFIISSWTHSPYHFHDEIGSLINYGLPAICIQAIYLMIQKKIMSHRTHRKMAKETMTAVHNYMKTHKFSETHRKNILCILENKLNYSAKVKLIDIFPKHENYEIFFSSFFSLNPDKLTLILKMGYKRTLEVFKKRDWDND